MYDNDTKTSSHEMLSMQFCNANQRDRWRYPDFFMYSSFSFHIQDPLKNHNPIPKGGMVIAGGGDIEKPAVTIRA